MGGPEAFIAGSFPPFSGRDRSVEIPCVEQERTVKDYQRQFELMAAPLPTIPESVMEGNFMNGLSPKICAEVRMMRPQGLGHIMEIAHRVEDRNESLKRAHLRAGPFVSKNSSSKSACSPNSFSPTPAPSR